MASPPRSDRHLLALAFLPLGATLFIGTVSSFSDIAGFRLFLLGLLAALIWLLIMIVISARLAWHRRWGRALLTAAILVLVWPAMPPLIRAGDYLHFALLYPYYFSKLDDRPTASFAWGDRGGFAGSQIVFRSVQYDRTGKLAAEEGNGTLDTGVGEPKFLTSTQHLFGDFYLRQITTP